MWLEGSFTKQAEQFLPSIKADWYSQLGRERNMESTDNESGVALGDLPLWARWESLSFEQVLVSSAT